MVWVPTLGLYYLTRQDKPTAVDRSLQTLKKPAVSVNSYTGQVWYHTCHGAFIQEVEFD